MLEWLLASFDPARSHEIGSSVSWHARSMVFAWSFLVPVGILAARFFKILPRQNWPTHRDNPIWWHTHLFMQYGAGVFTLIALWLIWGVTGTRESAFLHHFMGWTVVVLYGVQYLARWLRGSKGGPTEVAKTGTIRGDHFDMTPRRVLFERVHKFVGYVCLLAALVAVFSGLWLANAPRWMWIVLVAWWIAIIMVFVRLQVTRGAVETYEAIWGSDPSLPGNQRKPIGWGIKKRGP